MVCLDTIKPHVTREFLQEFRRLGKQVGYRNLGRAIAYLDTMALVPTSTTPTVSRSGQRRNGRKGKHQWFCRGNGRKHTCVCYSVCRECLVNPPHRFSHNPTGMFSYSFLVTSNNGGRPSGRILQAIASAMSTRECCGYPMGLMPNSLDPSRWRYQCAVDPKHSRDIRVAIGYSPS